MGIQVLICDDDPIVRDALAGYLRAAPEMEVDAHAGTAEEALAALAEQVPDVVLMDLAMPGMGGIAGALEIRAAYPQVAVLLLTTFGTDDQVREALAAGAAGFLLKSASAASLVAAVQAAAAGAGVVITPEVAAALAGGRRPAPASSLHTGDRPASGEHGAAGDAEDAQEDRAGMPAAPTDAAPAPTSPVDAGSGPGEAAALSLGLTDRELEVLHLLCRADTNTQIANQLVLSESTVKKHVTSLMAKLGCTSRLQIAVRAFELGLAEPPVPRS
ncbi:response regulator transcription factor [Brachybacterium phenoliresistens]|uniref:response regulator transcription factor n=1 Tax=Brachybacterium phenoliresistens TaxID=396014 RepID=UPI0031D1C987